jgi:hypothetical protein
MSDDVGPTNGPQRIAPSDVSQPRGDQPIVELRFVNPNGETEVWMLGKNALPWGDKDFRAAVRLAYLDYGVDTRLGIQLAAINRLLDHVRSHHADLRSEFDVPGHNWRCKYQAKD